MLHPKNLLIRPARVGDATALLRVYETYVLHTTFTPEYTVPSLTAFEKHISNVLVHYPYLVCVQDDNIVGYTYAHTYRNASGHQWSAEATIYLTPEKHGKGLATILYNTLFAILKLQGFKNIFAGIILPNDKSVAFHRKMYFNEVGVFKNGIYKSNHWHDVKWMQLSLGEHAGNPTPPRLFSLLTGSTALEEIISAANEKLL